MQRLLRFATGLGALTVAVVASSPGAGAKDGASMGGGGGGVSVGGVSVGGGGVSVGSRGGGVSVGGGGVSVGSRGGGVSVGSGGGVSVGSGGGVSDGRGGGVNGGGGGVSVSDGRGGGVNGGGGGVSVSDGRGGGVNAGGVGGGGTAGSDGTHPALPNLAMGVSGVTQEYESLCKTGFTTWRPGFREQPRVRRPLTPRLTVRTPPSRSSSTAMAPAGQSATPPQVQTARAVDRRAPRPSTPRRWSTLIRTDASYLRA